MPLPGGMGQLGRLDCGMRPLLLQEGSEFQPEWLPRLVVLITCWYGGPLLHKENCMSIKIQQWGNSAAIRLPSLMTQCDTNAPDAV